MTDQPADDNLASIPPPPTPATLAGLAKAIDETRGEVRSALRNSLRAALMSEQTSNRIAAYTAQPPVVVNMPAPSRAHAWTTAATVLGGLGSFLGGMALVAFVAWIVATGHTPDRLPPPPPPEQVVWSSSVVPIP